MPDGTATFWTWGDWFRPPPTEKGFEETELLAPLAEEKLREEEFPRWSAVVHPEKIIIAPRIKMLIIKLVFIIWDPTPE